MPLITVTDLLNELPGIRIDATTTPSEAAVTGFIGEIEAEIEALWLGAGCLWPDAGSPAAAFPRLTALLGAKWRTLDAKFTLASAGMTPDAVAQARLAYNDRLKRIPQVCVGAAETTVATISAPLVGIAAVGTVDGSSFGEWTQRRDRSLRRPIRPPWGGWTGDSGW